MAETMFSNIPARLGNGPLRLAYHFEHGSGPATLRHSGRILTLHSIGVARYQPIVQAGLPRPYDIF
jgi:hypothetical protein